MRRIGDLDPGKRSTAVLFAALGLAGLTILTLTVIGMVQERAESARLQAAGVLVVADVIDWSSGNRSSRPIAFEIAYTYQGEGHVAGVHCNPFHSCPVTSGGVVRIWVDPDRPGHFATDFGDTDGSTSWFTNIGMLVPGVAAALVGGFGAYNTLTRTEQPKPQRPRRRRQRDRRR
ncbi:DUF3592 domain-containing protein [Dactylosporangium sp. NPDC000244]|uniref:DUF3592 domain-containing protein n=1 Tax=Dactylosporangium sp. NPDC000244 TaxID=3154365 RepID=UPI00331A37CA